MAILALAERDGSRDHTDIIRAFPAQKRG